jgi:hypothetical protein
VAASVARYPVYAAEFSRVAKPEHFAVGKAYVHMVMFQNVLADGHDTQTSGHAKVHHQGAGIGFYQQVLGPPVYCAYPCILHQDRQFCRDWPPELAFTYRNVGNFVVEDMGFDAEAGGFYFG